MCSSSNGKTLWWSTEWRRHGMFPATCWTSSDGEHGSNTIQARGEWLVNRLNVMMWHTAGWFCLQILVLALFLSWQRAKKEQKPSHVQCLTHAHHWKSKVKRVITQIRGKKEGWQLWVLLPMTFLFSWVWKFLLCNYKLECLFIYLFETRLGGCPYFPCSTRTIIAPKSILLLSQSLQTVPLICLKNKVLTSIICAVC